ncbi:hypothetical protein A2U01_0044945, partial [Trifolium medium]|nr:hypothetical protein [Trifolium medium]
MSFNNACNFDPKPDVDEQEHVVEHEEKAEDAYMVDRFVTT